MNAAKLEKSPRLQRVRDFICDGREYSTLQIVLGARVCAVNSCIAELRLNGLEIRCRSIMQEGQRIWYYQAV